MGALVLAGLFLATSSSWAATTGILALPIQHGSTFPDGSVAQVTPLGDSFTTARGASQVAAGVELFRIDFTDGRFSDLAEIHVFLLNPQGLPQTLNSPAVYIDVAVWYPDGAGQHTLSDGTTKVIKDAGEIASGRMRAGAGNALIHPTVAGASTVYVLASVTSTQGGQPASQVGLGAVQFAAEVRL
jgi:hypothetical protein